LPLSNYQPIFYQLNRGQYKSQWYCTYSEGSARKFHFVHHATFSISTGKDTQLTEAGWADTTQPDLGAQRSQLQRVYPGRIRPSDSYQ